MCTKREMDPQEKGVLGFLWHIFRAVLLTWTVNYFVCVFTFLTIPGSSGWLSLSKRHLQLIHTKLGFWHPQSLPTTLQLHLESFLPSQWHVLFFLCSGHKPSSHPHFCLFLSPLSLDPLIRNMFISIKYLIVSEGLQVLWSSEILWTLG